MKVIKKDSIESTNNFASDLLIKNKIVEETVIYTDSQTKGKGLGTNTWLSEDYKNLIFSLVVFPEIKVERHFILSMIISLAICDYLDFKGVKAQIKWPNDIYYKNKKLAGILIENSIYGDTLKSSIIGIGLNLNQKEFPVSLPNPISLTNITSEIYDVDKEVEIISKIISDKLIELKNENYISIHKYYLERLYLLGCLAEFKAEGKILKGQIKDVKSDGHLIVCDLNFEEHEYYFKEIEFL